ncbi:hypothetical protein [Halorientalis marina]|uniref:hypothetical protein n=1 Tax=Halorientalis marina TaxID=2931976 RepID=UPI001FF6748D|nr:hypothetical protein [Halorientalis marina]
MTEPSADREESPANQFDPNWPTDIDDLDDVAVREIGKEGGTEDSGSGPEATPPIRASLRASRPLGQLFHDDQSVTIEVSEGSTLLVSLQVDPVEYQTPTQTVRTEPPLKCFTDEIQAAVVKTLSLSMQPLVDVASLDS